MITKLEIGKSYKILVEGQNVNSWSFETLDNFSITFKNNVIFLFLDIKPYKYGINRSDISVFLEGKILTTLVVNEDYEFLEEMC